MAASLAAWTTPEGLHQPALPSTPYTVEEVRVRTALTPCTYPGIPWSLNPYLGCAHACRFCYVPTLQHVDRATWGAFVKVKRNLPTVLAQELRTKRRDLVAVSTSTDPYQPVEARCLVTRRCLEVLARADWPVSVLSRSPLLLRDLDLFRRFTRFDVGMSVPTLDDAARRALEPGAPSIDARLRCLRALADEGFRPFVSLAPCYPLTGGVTAGAFADALADAGVAEVSLGAYRHYGDSWAHMRGPMRAAGVPGLERMADARHMARVVQDLRGALRARGIEA